MMIPRKLTVNEQIGYYQNKDLARQMVIQDATEDGHVIYGATAINAQVTPQFQKPTSDVDIKVKNPKKEAKQMEKKLDKKFKGDYFSVHKAKYKDTYKVKSNVTGETVVDYTKLRKQVPVKQVLGTRYEDLSSIKRSINKTLRDESSSFRHDKDMESLQRIKLNEAQLDW